MNAIKNYGRRFASLPIETQIALVCGVACAAGYLLNAIKR